MKMKYTHLYADADGESHFQDREIELRAALFAPPAPPMFLSDLWPATHCVFVAVEAGWYGDWHPAPRRQFIFYLAGTLEVSVSDGEVRTFVPGDILLVEDTMGKGHISRVTGTTPVLHGVVQLPE